MQPTDILMKHTSPSLLNIFPVSANLIFLGAAWGVAQGCNCRSILDAIATLIEAQRPDLAMILVKQELNSHT